MALNTKWPDAPWCYAAFGPLRVGKHYAYSCRLKPGHTGPHDCGAAQEAGYRDHDPRPVRPRGRSDAAQVVFGAPADTSV